MDRVNESKFRYIDFLSNMRYSWALGIGHWTLGIGRVPYFPENRYSNPKLFVNFLLPDRGFGEGWGGVKNLRLLRALLYLLNLNC